MTNWNNIVKNAEIIANGSSANGAAASPTGIDFLDSLLYPNWVEEREFGQQAAFQEMQNNWSVGGKMAAGKAAGINANALAEGISGSSSPSVGSPNSAVGAGAAGTGAVAQGIEAASNAVNAGVNAYEKLNLTSVEKEKRSAETISLLEAAGLSHWEAKAIEVMLPDRKKNLQADTFLKIANYRNTCEEYHNIVLEHDRRKADIDRIQKEANLLEQQGNYVKSLELKTQAETDGINLDNWWSQTNKTFWEINGYRADDPMDVALRNAAANGKLGAAEAVGNAIEAVSKSERKGFNAAELEDAFNKAFNQVAGENSANAEFAQFFADVDAWKQIFVDMWKNANENPDDVQGVIAKAMNQILNIVSNWQITLNKNLPRNKPNVSPRP